MAACSSFEQIKKIPDPFLQRQTPDGDKPIRRVLFSSVTNPRFYSRRCNRHFSKPPSVRMNRLRLMTSQKLLHFEFNAIGRRPEKWTGDFTVPKMVENVWIETSLLVFQTIKLRQRADEKAVAGDGGRGHAHFVEGVFVQQLVFGAGGEDVGIAVFAQRENFSVRGPR